LSAISVLVAAPIFAHRLEQADAPAHLEHHADRGALEVANHHLGERPGLRSVELRLGHRGLSSLRAAAHTAR
jgi:hypothetical protein